MISSKNAYSILDIKNNVFLSKDGSISVNFFIENPEPYSMDEIKLDLRHTNIVKAFKYVVKGVYIQMQNVVIESTYSSHDHYYTQSYITSADAKHFEGRASINNYTLLSFTLTDLKSLSKSYIANPLSYKENLTVDDKDTLDTFFESIKGAVGIINSLYNTTITEIDETSLKQILINYVNGFHNDGSLRDIVFGSRMEIGDHKYTVFSISDNSYFPDEISNVVDDNTLNRNDVQLKTGLMDEFGVFFPKNHIYNQVIFIKGHEVLKEEFAERIREFEKHQSFNANIKNESVRLNKVYTEALERNHTLCKAHYNIIIWDENIALLKKKEDKVKEILNRKEIKYYIPSYEGLSNIFLGTIIGRQKKLHKDYLFLTTLELASCLLTNYSLYQNDEEGIVFQDRLQQVPIRRDWWDAKKKRISARNFLLFAPTGSGKSSAVLNILQQFLEQDYKLVVAEFGASFEQLAKLYPEKSAHIKFTMNTPLGINPFDLGGQEFSKNKLANLTEIVMLFWRLSAEVRRKETTRVAVTMTIDEYYSNVESNHSFPSYYHFIIENYEAIFEKYDIQKEYFDISSFKLVCSQFLEGGLYENVCKGNEETENVLIGKDFIVFEMSEIVSDSFLVSLVLTILNDTVQEKILSDRSKKGYLIFDEMAKSQQLQSEYSGEDILSTVAFLYQSIRKETGGVGCIYQTPAQLPKDNPHAESMIDNTQILGVLQATESVFDRIINRFKIKNQEHIDLMKSIQNDFTGYRPYSEMFLRFNQEYATVVRMEFSKEKYYAFQTEGQEWAKIQRFYKETGSMEESINKIIKQEQ